MHFICPEVYSLQHGLIELNIYCDHIGWGVYVEFKGNLDYIKNFRPARITN